MVANELQPICRRWQRLLWGMGILGSAAAAVAGSHDPVQFFRSYLFAYLFWISLPLGALVFALIVPLVGGAWFEIIRPVVRACLGTMPLAMLSFVPVVLGMRSLYPWIATPANAAAYLTVPGFIGRGVFAFAVWSIFAFLARHGRLPWRRLPPDSRKLQAICAGGLVLHVVLVTMVSVDWGLSLEVGYSSTNYGFIYLASQTLAALAFAVAATTLLQSRGLLAMPPLNKPVPRAVRDLGSLLAMNVLLWAYLQYSQLIVNWAGDTKHEISWYLHRSSAGWQRVALVLIALHFVVPFFVLLLRRVKSVLPRLGWVAFAILAVHVVAVFWLIEPSFGAGMAVHWLDLATWLSLGGFWLGTFAWLLGRDGREEPMTIQEKHA